MPKILEVLRRPWRRFAGDVTGLKEKDTWTLLEAEIHGQKRSGYLRRLYEHANELRRVRQKTGLLTKGKLPEDRP